LDSVSEWLRR